jgi:hypothetical protein
MKLLFLLINKRHVLETFYSIFKNLSNKNNIIEIKKKKNRSILKIIQSIVNSNINIKKKKYIKIIKISKWLVLIN